MTASIPDGLQPVWVGDSNAPEWECIYADRNYYQRLIAWLRSEGFDEQVTHRVEVYLLDAPFARVHQWCTDERGRISVNEAGDDALTVVRTALLSSLPPAKEEA